MIQKPFVLTIFGASGDLAKIKLFPAIYSLMQTNKLPKEFHIIGFARTKKTREQFQSEFKKSIEKVCKNIDYKKLQKLINNLHYISGQYDEAESYEKLKQYIKEITRGEKLLKISYLSVPPTVFKSIIKNLGSYSLSFKKDMTIVIEKPFGGDVISATSLYYFIVQYFDEDQIYLLDHYLGKQSVRSILHLRHHNRILNLMLKGKEIQNIQITAIEDIGIKNRIGYFNQVGMIRDMLQSHLLQLLALVTMSIPITEKAEAIHKEKENILSALTLGTGQSTKVVLGQYSSYKKATGVTKDSNTETFAATRLFIDRESWYGVPIYIRTGKKLQKKHTSIVVTLKKFGYQKRHEEPNRVLFELYPNERLCIRLLSKSTRLDDNQIIIAEHKIGCDGGECMTEYANLLYEVFQKEREYFLSFPEIIASWKITDKIIDHVKRHEIKTEIYHDYSCGPRAQRQLTAQDRTTWFDTDKKSKCKSKNLNQ